MRVILGVKYYKDGDYQMNGNKNESKKTAISVILLCVVVLMLSVFTVLVYRGKRLTADEFKNDRVRPVTSAVSQSDQASPSDKAVTSQPVASSETSSVDDVSSTAPEAVSSEAVSSEAVSSETVSSEPKKDTATKNDILNPDYKSDFYMVVYVENQEIVIYKKGDNGKYIHRFHALKCSTGAPDTTPTKEGVYKIGEKEKWVELKDGEFGQYCCQLSKEDNYYFSSIPFSKKDPSTMIDGGYENIGTAVSGGGIQLCSRDAYWIYLNMPKGTQVRVVNKAGPEVKFQSRPKRKSQNGNWDPTDKRAEGNPYFKK